MRSAAAILLLAMTAAARAGDSDCCFDNGTVRCTDFACTNLVCDDDVFCCTVSWDLNCARQAETLCGLCTPGGQACPGPDDCCVATGTPGCDDPACCDAVCGDDPYCCEGRWDVFCAADARALCPPCAGAMPCAAPDPGDCCRDNGTPGCEDPACCDAVCLADAFCCETRWDLTCAARADQACVGVCDVECPVEGDCCIGRDEPGCDDPICCAAVCFNDPTCCHAVWDALCAEVAASVCAACGGGGFGGDCCAANATPGCDDPGCTLTICDLDPFCCDTKWDQICVDQALVICRGVCFERPACPGDTDDDGDVDVDDLNHVILDWGTDGSANGGDVTDASGTGPPDGMVDVNDLNAVVVNWGACAMGVDG